MPRHCHAAQHSRPRSEIGLINRKQASRGVGVWRRRKKVEELPVVCRMRAQAARPDKPISKRGDLIGRIQIALQVNCLPGRPAVHAPQPANVWKLVARKNPVIRRFDHGVLMLHRIGVGGGGARCLFVRIASPRTVPLIHPLEIGCGQRSLRRANNRIIVLRVGITENRVRQIGHGVMNQWIVCLPTQALINLPRWREGRLHF